MVKFNVTLEESRLITEIAKRAEAEVDAPFDSDLTVVDTEMDLTATVANGCPMKLKELLEADHFNFAHDICGIRRHLNRKTGRLEGFFLPRYAAIGGDQ